MMGIGIFEMLFLFAIAGIAGLVVAYFVVRAAVRVGNRDQTSDQ